MARLNEIFESDEELPELSTILRATEIDDIKPAGTDVVNKHSYKRSAAAKTNPSHMISTNTPCDEKIPWKQWQLGTQKPPGVRPSHLPDSKQAIASAKDEKVRSIDKSSARSSPNKLTKTSLNYLNYNQHVSDLSSASILTSDDGHSCTELSDFTVPDSASDEESIVESPRKGVRRSPAKSKLRLMPSRTISETRQSPEIVDLLSEKKKPSVICLESPPRQRSPSMGSDRAEIRSTLNDRFTQLKCSAPRFEPPHKSKEGSRPVTPPSSPSKLRLQSPSKQQRIPPSPHRPSIDAFWSHDVINDWNEQYSPKKSLTSPRKSKFASLDEGEDQISPSESPPKSALKGPAKRDKAAIERRKAFDEKKHKLATSFLSEVDQTLTSGQVASMAEPTGGIKIVWSKKLSTTAGRANWRREGLRSKDADGTLSTLLSYHHHASIELAEKVIDDEDRLTNVIAHEYCHLANFMISGIKANPHGKEFKEWARKCSKAFSHRGINVTTKHTYTVTYKYVWTCMSPTCGIEYKRHSKSIDPARHLCGSCKGRLVQVQPAPRKECKRSDYRDFVKKEHERVRRENPSAGFGEIMAILGREFRENKRIEVEKVRNSKPADEPLIQTGLDTVDGLNSMVSKLVTLSLDL